MSVQNLREKFNQPSNGTVSPPGTSFGSVKPPPSSSPTTVKSEPPKTTKTSPFGPSINTKVPSHFRTPSYSPATSSRGSSPDRLVNCTPKPYINGCLDGKTTTRKSPEQSQQDIIQRKWSQNSLNNLPEFANGSKESTITTQPSWVRNSESTTGFSTLSRPKHVISKYISHLSMDSGANDCDTTCENNSITPERAAQLKNKYEIDCAKESIRTTPEHFKNKYEINNIRVENGVITPDRAEQLKSKYEINCTVDSPSKKWEQPSFDGTSKSNSSFLNSVRSKVNGDIGSGCKSNSSTPTLTPSCNGLKKTNSSDWWKTNNNHEETEGKNIQTNKVLLPTQDYSNLEKKYHRLQKNHDELKQELKEKNDQLTQLRILSEAMYKEYDQLQNQYKLETSTMQQAMERATEWYKQNRELKRQSTALMQHVIAMKPDAISEMGDEVDTYSEQDSEIEALRKTIHDLTRDMSKLQAELNSIKMKENEAQERIACLTKELDQTRRNISSKDALKLKDRRATFETNNQSDSVEEKLRATEVELQLALERANQAEAETLTLANKVSELQSELQDIKNRAASVTPAPPAPPPPPPPPPLPASTSTGLNNITKVVLRKRGDQSEDSAAEQMADLLGIPKKTGIPSAQGGAIDDLINEIKRGGYSLKATEKQNTFKKEEPPPVVHEIMNVLGTLRRQPNRRDQSSERSIDIE